ncbi:MAG: NAD-dependent protein deacylase [Actinomycetaceae bacterium]|nr:NAD-dependent protein deacylase [Actinomycetaceae bacterium]MDY5854359.1 NAD-dependent protein deacylase [Arcanobacterium sp.]
MNSLRDIVTAAHNIVFFGGAGVSTESGIPDFRSATGLYSTASGAYPPEYMVSHSCFIDHPEDFFAFYRTHLLFPHAEPNPAHRALAALEAAGKVSAVVTQNIDGLHQAAGSQHVAELHGSVHRNYCTQCSAFYPMQFVLDAEAVPVCTRCGGIVKPDVVLYEEPLDEAVMSDAIQAISQADALIIGGTSLNVYPAAGLIHYFGGKHLVLINKSETAIDTGATLTIREPIGKVLSEFIPN